MGSAAAESAFKRELLFSQDALRQKPTLKVDQLFSIRLLLPRFPAGSYRLIRVSQLHQIRADTSCSRSFPF